MSRSDYSDDFDGWGLVMWRGAVTSAMRGKRGQAFLREMLGALESLPEKRLITSTLQTLDGSVCALGSVGVRRNLDMAHLDPDDYDQVASFFGIAPALVREIEAQNDDHWCRETPEHRWQRMCNWVASALKEEWR